MRGGGRGGEIALVAVNPRAIMSERDFAPTHCALV